MDHFRAGGNYQALGRLYHGKVPGVAQRQFVAPAVRRAGDGEINDALAFGRHGAVGVADGLRVEPVTHAQCETVRLINQGRVNLVGDDEAKDQRVIGVETKRLFDLDFVVVEITDERLAVVSGEVHVGDTFELLRFKQRKRLG